MRRNPHRNRRRNRNRLFWQSRSQRRGPSRPGFPAMGGRRRRVADERVGRRGSATIAGFPGVRTPHPTVIESRTGGLVAGLAGWCSSLSLTKGLPRFSCPRRLPSCWPSWSSSTSTCHSYLAVCTCFVPYYAIRLRQTGSSEDSQQSKPCGSEVRALIVVCRLHRRNMRFFFIDVHERWNDRSRATPAHF